MKLGILSDIHADLPGLERALALFQRQNVDQIVCAGDLVDGTTPGEGVVRHFRGSGIPCVMGNHDEDAIAPGSVHYRRVQQTDPPFDALTADSLTYLQGLPRQHEFTAGGLRVLLAHGVPSSNRIYLWSFAERHDLQRAAHSAKSDVLILGHTHDPMLVKVDGVTIVNPGSVRLINGSGTCAILTLPDLDYTVYDLATELSIPYQRPQL